VVVIGGGPGGYVAAIKAAQLGFKVTCVEKRGTLGGTCLNVGCIPSKALLHSSHLYEEATKHFGQYGVKVSGVEIDIPTMMKAKDKAVTGLTSGIEFLFKKNKVNYEKGFGKISGRNEITVTGADGKTSKIQTKNIVIATGSEPVELPFLKFDEKRVVSSTGALSLAAIPKRLALVGGGVIGLEMGSVWRRLGSEVTVVEYTDAICAGADKDVANEVKKILTKQGMKFKMGFGVKAADVSADKIVLQLESREGGKKETLETDTVLVSVGRRPFTDNLGLEAVGVKVDQRGRVEIDDHWRTSVPNIFAIGDVVRGPMLAHKAEEEGVAVAEQLKTGHGHVDFGAIPSVIYLHPEVAWVGKTEQELKDAGVDYRVGKFPMSANSRARTIEDSDGFVKFLADAKTDRVLGCHIIGNAAGEMIAEASLLMTYKGSSEDLARTCHAHPTFSEAVKEAAMATYDKPIHF
jgi:dihydrolipoamide dehydrogenase